VHVREYIYLSAHPMLLEIIAEHSPNEEEGYIVEMARVSLMIESMLRSLLQMQAQQTSHDIVYTRTITRDQLAFLADASSNQPCSSAELASPPQKQKSYAKSKSSSRYAGILATHHL
jgi:hypothetical protein